MKIMTVNSCFGGLPCVGTAGFISSHIPGVFGMFCLHVISLLLFGLFFIHLLARTGDRPKS